MKILTKLDTNTKVLTVNNLILPLVGMLTLSTIRDLNRNYSRIFVL